MSSSDRDTTRIVRSWLEDGSTAMPDRVLDAVLADLPSTAQRRSRWPLWRFPDMKPIIMIAGTAGAVILAVALLPTIAGVGGPSGERPITGEVTFFLGGADVHLVVDAVTDGASVRGTARAAQGQDGSDPSTVDVQLECLDVRADDTWVLGGTIDASTFLRVGSRAAVIVRDGDSQAFDFWIQGNDPDAADCAAFLAGIPEDVPLQPALDGGLQLPD